MAKQKEVTINGQKFKLQSVSPRFYYEMNDSCGMTGNKKDTPKYLDEMFKNIVIEPKEVSVKGLDYFDDFDDIDTSEKLLIEIESFLRERKQCRNSSEERKAE